MILLKHEKMVGCKCQDQGLNIVWTWYSSLNNELSIRKYINMVDRLIAITTDFDIRWKVMNVSLKIQMIKGVNI